MSSDTDLAYAAGLIDGEGCFSTHDNGNGYFGLDLRVVNRDKACLDWLALKFGGKVYKKGGRNLPSHWSKTYMWVATAGVMRGFLDKMLPYFIVKTKHAQVVSRFLSLPYGSIGRRTDLAEELRSLNKAKVQ